MIALPPAVALELDAAAQRHHVPAELARAIAWVESRGEQSARSGAGAIGVMQLMPATAESLGVDPYVRAANIDGGVRMLAHLIAKFGDTLQVPAAYVWGPGNVQGHPSESEWPERVQRYAHAVQERRELERGTVESVATLDMPRTGARAFGAKRDDHAHNGVDLRAGNLAPIYAAAAGEVEHAHDDPDHEGFSGYGRVVVVRDGEGKRQLYAHLERVGVVPGSELEAGQQLGAAGHSGNATGDVLHFEVSEHAYPQSNQAPRLDPLAWLVGRVHPVARVIVGGNGAPSPFAPASPPLRSSLPRSALSVSATALLDRWLPAAAELRELCARIEGPAMRERAAFVVEHAEALFMEALTELELRQPSPTPAADASGSSSSDGSEGAPA